MFQMIESNSRKIIQQLCAAFKDNDALNQEESWVIFNVKAKLSATKDADIYIQYGKDNVEKFYESSNVENRDLPAFFYIYHCGKSLPLSEKKKVIDIINSYIS